MAYVDFISKRWQHYTSCSTRVKATHATCNIKTGTEVLTTLRTLRDIRTSKINTRNTRTSCNSRQSIKSISQYQDISIQLVDKTLFHAKMECLKHRAKLY